MLARAMYGSGVWRLYESGPWIVAYHGVVERIRDPWLERNNLVLSQFREHLDYFERHRVVVALDELLGSISENRTPDPRFAVLCFDDALASLVGYVIPEVSARRMPFVIGVPTALPSTGRSLWEYEAAFLVHLLASRGALRGLAGAMRDVMAGMDRDAKTWEGLGCIAAACSGRGAAPRASMMLREFLRLEVSSDQRIGVVDRLVSELQPDFHERLAGDGRFSVMQWDQLRGACSVGGTLSAHGHFHHPHNSTLTDSTRGEELRAPVQSFKHYTGIAPDSFIWPEGGSDVTSIKIGVDLGYKYFLSSRAGLVSCRTAPTDVPRVSGQWSLAQVLWNAASLT